ncbi:uncharacterized protein LOC126998200 [Eriocheir sinensis]|uniref:uncharacterized protein LOC126998200 n=1 Tax=Eriocheir sinensis TaxID=95602 RepID=UPI0021C93F00|nr:uncharacterized protein LOC126998200 [Eriocheir sinensis]
MALDKIIAWSGCWQVTLAPDKTQAMVISRRRDINNLAGPGIQLEGKTLPLQDSISILGVGFDAGLSFTNHAKKISKNAAWKLSCVRRISHLLDAKGTEVLYKAQVRPLMEYSPLAWSSCPPSYLATLDRVQARAQRLIQRTGPQHARGSLQPLQERRDVAGLCVMFKAHNLNTPHLAALRLPAPPTPIHSTRAAPHRQEQVAVPFSRTEHHIRSFQPRYSRLWNQLVRHTDLHHRASLQDFNREREVDDLNSSKKDYEKEKQDAKAEIEKLTEQVESSHLKIRELEERLNYQEDYSRRSNVRISGMEERGATETWEQTAAAVTSLLEEKMQLPGLVLERAHRVGVRRDARPRPIVARFSRYCDREAVMRNSKKLRGTNIFVNDDLCAASQAVKNAQMPLLKQARAQGKVAFFRHTKLIIKDKTSDVGVDRMRQSTGTAGVRGVAGAGTISVPQPTKHWGS